jgi:hypothetical protein
MSTVLGLIWGPSTWTAEETFSIVPRTVFVVGGQCRHQFVVTSNWHTQFDARKWLLLPDIAVLQDVRDFVNAVIAARNNSTGTQIRIFHSKVSSPSVVDIFWL